MPEIYEDKGLMLYLEEAGLSEPLSAEEERELSERIKQGDLEARDKLVRANLRFVVSVAKQFQNCGLDLTDLINEGNIGLITAAGRFDGTKGFKFISYAVWWVRQAIIQALAEQARTIRLPSNSVALVEKIRRVSEDFRQEQERDPEFNDIAAQIGVSIEEIQRTLEAARNTWSLDAVFDSDDDARNLFDVTADTHTPAPDAGLTDESIKQAIAQALGTLEEREAEVITLCFGLGGEEPLTLDEIGVRLDLTRERARQIKEIALRRLRHPKRARELATVLDGFEPNEVPRGIGPAHSAPSQYAALLDASRPEVLIILKRMACILRQAGVILRIARNGGMTSVRLLVKQIHDHNHNTAQALRHFGILNQGLAIAIEREYQALLRATINAGGNGKPLRPPLATVASGRKEARIKFLGALDEIIKTKEARAEFLSVLEERARALEEHEQQETQERSMVMATLEKVSKPEQAHRGEMPTWEQLRTTKTFRDKLSELNTPEELDALVELHSGDFYAMMKVYGIRGGVFTGMLHRFLKARGVELTPLTRVNDKHVKASRPKGSKTSGKDALIVAPSPTGAGDEPRPPANEDGETPPINQGASDELGAGVVAMAQPAPETPAATDEGESHLLGFTVPELTPLADDGEPTNDEINIAIRKARHLGPIAEAAQSFLSRFQNSAEVKRAVKALTYYSQSTANDHLPLSKAEQAILEAFKHLQAAHELLVPQEREPIVIEEAIQS